MIVDITTVCAEIFRVKDARSGIVIKRMDDWSEELEVSYDDGVEVVTESDDDERDGKARKVRSWKIIDVDEMLNGNVFH